MTVTVEIQEACNRLASLLDRVKTGDEIIIRQSNAPVARLVPFAARANTRAPGTARGKITLAPDFDEPLPDEVLREFEA